VDVDVKFFVIGCRLLIIAGDCDTICDVLLDIIPMLEEASSSVLVSCTAALLTK